MTAVPQWLQENAAKLLHKTQEISWLNDFRAKQWDAFLQQGLPTQRDERWKYVDLSFLNSPVIPVQTGTHCDQAVQMMDPRLCGSDKFIFIDGHFSSHLSAQRESPAGVILCPLSQALKQYEDIVKTYWTHETDTKKYPFAGLNGVLFHDGLFLYLPDGCEVQMPIHLLFVAQSSHSFTAHPRNLIVLGKRSKLTFIEEYISLSANSYWMNVVNQIFVEQDAMLNYCKIQTEDEQARHLATTFIKQKKNSRVDFTVFSTGGSLARDDLAISLQEQEASCRTAGFYRLRHNDQYIDHHVDIDHRAARSRSEMLYKGILEKKSRAVFNGRIYVEQTAQKTSAYQGNHHLLLSPEAEVVAKPELEIYADDVQCKHGATVGQLDQEALFYLRSRGISQQEAMHILLQGFAADIMQRVTQTDIMHRVREIFQ